MDSKFIWALLALVGIYLLFIRKNTALVVGATSTRNVLNKGGYTPSPAIPQPSTTQIVTAAAVKNAPQIISALGAFFNGDNDVDTSSDDSLDDILG